MGKRIVIALVACLALVFGLVVNSLVGGPPMDDATRVRALIDHLASSAEAHDIKELRRHIARGFKGEQGRDRAWLNRLLTFHLLRRSALSVYVLSKDVTVESRGQRVGAVAKLLLTRSPHVKDLSRLVPEAAKALRLELSFERIDDRWQVVRARWKRLRFGDVLPGR